MGFALITGAGKGIGSCFAKQLAAQKYDLLLVSRTEKDLIDLKAHITEKYGVKVYFLAADLSLSDSVSKVLEWTSTISNDIEILINNAGYAVWGKFHEREVNSTLAMMHVNMDAVVGMCYGMIPVLEKAKKSYILNVCSTSAYQAVPTLAAYSASKSFVMLFTRGLAFELRKTNISVTCLSPGATDTEFVQRAGIDEKVRTKNKSLFMTPTQVAQIGIKAMFAGKTEKVTGMVNLISVWATYFLPKRMIENIAANIYKV